MDVTVYTGFGYAGRDLLLVRACDAIVIGCGRIGTINEFSVAFEDRRPIGILEGSWKTDIFLRELIEQAHRPNEKIVFDSDPKALVERLIEMAMKDKEENLVFRNPDNWGKADEAKEGEVIF
jgi:predicted Rossmann-fold nucleotide-binding protein